MLHVPSRRPHVFLASFSQAPLSSVVLLTLCRTLGPQLVSSDFNSAIGWNSICQEDFAVSHLIVEELAHEIGFLISGKRSTPGDLTCFVKIRG